MSDRRRRDLEASLAAAEIRAGTAPDSGPVGFTAESLTPPVDDGGASFTPGPWRWSDQFRANDGGITWSLLAADGYGILSCDGVANSPQGLGDEANARLIEAAPDLYAALEAMVLNDTHTYRDCHKAALVAISKARKGGS